MIRIILARFRSFRARLAAGNPAADPLPLVSCTAWTDRLEVI